MGAGIAVLFKKKFGIEEVRAQCKCDLLLPLISALHSILYLPLFFLFNPLFLLTFNRQGYRAVCCS